MEQQFRSDDFTPLGEALKAAIIHAVEAGKPASIFIVSDLDQTQGCGVDVCTVASALLPIEGIDVQAVPVFGADEVDTDKLGCIATAQGRNVFVVTGDPNDGGGGSTGTDYLATWFWLIGFVLLAGGAAAFGWRNSGHALYLENQTSDAREAREAIRAGEDGAKESFEALRTETLKKIKVHDWRKRQIAYWLLVVLGCAALFALAAVPDSAIDGRASLAKQAAWTVLDSDFATAFAGVWLALLFFWASQGQRSNEALRNFHMVTKEAERIEGIKRTKAEQAQFDEYDRQFNRVRGQRFRPPWSLSDGDDNEQAIADFQVVAERARILAAPTKLARTEDQNNILQETQRLQELISFEWYDLYLSFETFLQRLRRSDQRLEQDPDWTNLISAIGAREPKLIKERISVLASKLVADSAPR